MSDNDASAQQPTEGAYVLIGVVTLALLTATALVLSGVASIHLVGGVLLAGLFPLYVGYRSYKGSQRGNILTEHDGALASLKAASLSFWILFVTSMADAVFGVLPDDMASESLFLLGAVTIAVLTVYYRFVSVSSLDRSELA